MSFQYDRFNEIGNEIRDFFPNLISGFDVHKERKHLAEKLKSIDVDELSRIKKLNFREKKRLEKLLGFSSQDLAEGIKCYLIGTQEDKIKRSETANVYPGKISYDEYSQIINSQKGKKGGIEALKKSRGYESWTLEEEERLRNGEEIVGRSQASVRKKRAKLLGSNKVRVDWNELEEISNELFENFKYEPDCYLLIAQKLVQVYPKYEGVIDNRKVLDYFRRQGISRREFGFKDYGWNKIEKLQENKTRIEFLNELSQVPYFQEKGGLVKLAKLGSHLFYEGQKEIKYNSLFVALNRFRSKKE